MNANIQQQLSDCVEFGMQLAVDGKEAVQHVLPHARHGADIGAMLQKLLHEPLPTLNRQMKRRIT